ncbi:MAG: fliC [Phycisphaerales bacterium]|nr:fliC [Phycisphaerales bacterium]MDB5304648.1 fliC [Phycisphaerales bacterium]
MSRINTNVASLTAQLGLSRSQQTLNTTLQRLSSGLRINAGADDPAGLIASESLRSELAGIHQAVDNSQQAGNVIATAEGSLSEVSSLLLNIKSLVVQAANSGALSPDEIAANQLQVDSAVESITRISNTTNFAGLHLINGNLDYLTSGVNTAAIKSLDIAQAHLGTNPNLPVQVNVITSAQTANLQFKSSAIVNSVTLTITGTDGAQTLTFTSGTAASAIAYAVNGISDSTGVTAAQITAGNITSGIAFHSTRFGSKNFVSVTAQTGSFATVDTAGSARSRVTGRDAVATVNGALVTGDGLNLKVNTGSLDMNMTLANTFGAGNTRFAVTGGGALFQLGAQVSSNQQVSIGISSVAASKLGDSNVGFLNQVVTGGTSTLVGGQSATAEKIIETAIGQISVLRGRLGAFQKNTLETNVNSLQVAMENVTSSDSQIRDANFAQETANLTRAQILTQAGTSVLATANNTPQSVLTLLQGH